MYKRSVSIIIAIFLLLNSTWAFSYDVESLNKRITLFVTYALSKEGWEDRLKRNFEREWRLLNMDARLVEAINDATIETIHDTTYINKLIAGYIPARAKDVAYHILEEAFKRKDLQDAMKEVITRTYIRMFEETMNEKLIELFVMIGRDINYRYGEKITRDFIGYINDLIQNEKFDILEKVFDKDVLKDFRLHYDIAKLGVIGGLGILITLAVMKRIEIGFMKRIISRLTPQVLSKTILRLITWVTWVSVIWDLTHVNANIERIGQWLKVQDDVRDAVFSTLLDITYENAFSFFQKAAEDTAESFMRLYEGFLNQEGIK